MKKLLNLLIAFSVCNVSFAQIKNENIPISVSYLGNAHVQEYKFLKENVLNIRDAIMASGKKYSNSYLLTLSRNLWLNNTGQVCDESALLLTNNYFDQIVNTNNRTFEMAQLTNRSDEFKQLAENLMTNIPQLSSNNDFDNYLYRYSIKIKSCTMSNEEKELFSTFIVSYYVNYEAVMKKAIPEGQSLAPCWTCFWRGVKCGLGTAGGAVLGGIAGAGAGTITLPLIGTISGASAGFISGAAAGAAASCF
ncbi:MAG TPA: hypothetical protein VK498_10235 [Ferruginibacter sp.]|nr:hypothetical protein [Ferruginibacter sp.]